MWNRVKGTVLAVGFGLLTAGITGSAWAQDAFSSLTPMNPSQLGGVAIGNSLLMNNLGKAEGSVEDTFIGTIGDGKTNFTTGDVANNVIQNNRGVTTVIANTGANNNFNVVKQFNITLQ